MPFKSQQHCPHQLQALGCDPCSNLHNSARIWGCCWSSAGCWSQGLKHTSAHALPATVQTQIYCTDVANMLSVCGNRNCEMRVKSHILRTQNGFSTFMGIFTQTNSLADLRLCRRTCMVPPGSHERAQQRHAPHSQGLRTSWFHSNTKTAGPERCLGTLFQNQDA